MSRLFLSAATGIVGLHGLVHLMGFVAYWPLAVINELPYKTVLAGGHWNVGAGGMRAFSVLWLVTALGFLAAAVGMAAHQSWWRPLMLGTLVLSSSVIALDWAPAFRGAIVNLAILALLILTARLGGSATVR